MNQNQIEVKHQQIGSRELGFAVASFSIGVGTLSLPRKVAESTSNFDGWMSIMIGGVIIIIFTFVTASLAARFPKQSFFQFSTRIVSKPVAAVLTMIYAIYFMLYTAYESRMISAISVKYLFDRTPIEFIALSFLLVITYAVAGKSVAIMRLNLIFFPVFGSILVVLITLNMNMLEIRHFKPLFTTEWTDIIQAVPITFLSFLGFEIVLFYNYFVRSSRHIVKTSLIGISVPIIINLLIFTIVIGQLGASASVNMQYPTVELAKETEVPGGFLARFESLFFVIWVMAIFTTAAMALDIVILTIQSLFAKLKRIHILYVLVPLVYLIAMVFLNHSEISGFADWLSDAGTVLCMLIPLVLFIVAKLRGVKGNE